MLIALASKRRRSRDSRTLRDAAARRRRPAGVHSSKWVLLSDKAKELMCMKNGTASAVPSFYPLRWLLRLAFLHVLFGLFIRFLGFCFGVGRRLQVVDGFAQTLGRTASHLCLELVEGNAEVVRDVSSSHELAEVLEATRCLLQVSTRCRSDCSFVESLELCDRISLEFASGRGGFSPRNRSSLGWPLE